VGKVTTSVGWRKTEAQRGTGVFAAWHSHTTPPESKNRGREVIQNLAKEEEEAEWGTSMLAE